MGPGERGEKTGIWIINVLAATPRQIRGDAEGAVPSPDGSLIAFRKSSGTSNVSVVDPSGENVRVLATASLTEGFGKLQWSPDGKHIAVLVRYVGEAAAAIEAIAIADGARTVLARQEHLRTFVWLPDGRLILSVRPSETARSLLLEVYPDGKRSQLEDDPGVAIAEMSATADGKRLVVVRASEQSDVYAASFRRGAAIGEPVRVTLDERDDRPTAWYHDSQTVLFESTRNGTLDVFRQGLDSPAAEQVAAGPDRQYGAEVSPDGAAILYWSAPGEGERIRLLAVPINGGATTPVLEAPAASQFHCPDGAWPETSRCLLATPVEGNLRFEMFDWRSGNRELLRQVPFNPLPGAVLIWALSCDAGRLAFLDATGLRVIELRGDKASVLPAAEFPGIITGLAFSCASQEMVITTAATRENLLLALRDSRLRRIWSSSRPLASPVVSPDGQELLLGISTASSNAWLLENF